MALQNKKIGIIGTGNMGESLIDGIISFMKINPNDLYASDIDNSKLNAIKSKYKINTLSNSNLLDSVNIIILAVKPQQIDYVLKEIQAHEQSYDLVISIAAGIETAYIEKTIQKKTPVIRVMPNICATVNNAVSALSRGKFADENTFEIAKRLFESIGLVVEVEEQLMDVVTGLSGSTKLTLILSTVYTKSLSVSG